MVIRVRGIEIDTKTRTIRHDGRWEKFEHRNKPVGWKIIVALICGGGLTNGQLLDIVYGDDPDGGPELGYGQISVYLTQMRKRCARLGLTVRKFRTGHSAGNRYEIVPAEFVA